jgi:lipoyl(octanoyl) transferase
MPPTAPPFTVERWGLVPYAEATARQLERVAARKAGEIGDRLILVEHPPVFTIGVRPGADQHLVWQEAQLRATGVEVERTNRGGDITYHGPGQLVGYPILSLQDRRDLHAYLRDLEEVLLRSLRPFGLEALRREGLTGIWIGNRKIAAIGVAVKSWITYHGFALNVNPDLSHFNGIIPCGIASTEGSVTSLALELDTPPVWQAVETALIRNFHEVLYP